MIKKPRKKSPSRAGGRSRYTPEFRQEALLLAARVGVAAAEQLGVAPGLVYTAARPGTPTGAQTPSSHWLTAKYCVAWEPPGNDEIIASWRPF